MGKTDLTALEYIVRDALDNIAMRMRVGMGVFYEECNPLPRLDRIGFIFSRFSTSHPSSGCFLTQPRAIAAIR